MKNIFLKYWFNYRELMVVIGSLLGILLAMMYTTEFNSVQRYGHSVVTHYGIPLFFLLLAIEIKLSLLPGGGLASPKKAAFPIVMAFGGIACPALIMAYLLYFTSVGNLIPPDIRIWLPVAPTATDVSFSLAVLIWYIKPISRVGKNKYKTSYSILAASSILDDIVATVVMIFMDITMGTHINLIYFVAGITIAIGTGLFLNKKGVYHILPYLFLVGIPSFIGFEMAGMHTALSLIPLGFLIPARPKGELTEPHLHAPILKLQRLLENPVAIILFFFGFFATAVNISNVTPLTIAIIVAMVVGKLIGMIVPCLVAVWKGWLELPDAISWKEVSIVAGLGAIGLKVMNMYVLSLTTDIYVLDSFKCASFYGALAALVLTAFITNWKACLYSAFAYVLLVPYASFVFVMTFISKQTASNLIGRIKKNSYLEFWTEMEFLFKHDRYYGTQIIGLSYIVLTVLSISTEFSWVTLLISVGMAIFMKKIHVLTHFILKHKNQGFVEDEVLAQAFAAENKMKLILVQQEVEGIENLLKELKILRKLAEEKELNSENLTRKIEYFTKLLHKNNDKISYFKDKVRAENTSCNPLASGIVISKKAV